MAMTGRLRRPIENARVLERPIGEGKESRGCGQWKCRTHSMAWINTFCDAETVKSTQGSAMERQICDYHPATMAEMVMMQQYMSSHPNHWTSTMTHDVTASLYHGFPLDPYGDCASPIFKPPTYPNSVYAPPETMLGFSSDHYSLKAADEKDDLVSKNVPSGESVSMLSLIN